MSKFISHIRLPVGYGQVFGGKNDGLTTLADMEARYKRNLDRSIAKMSQIYGPQH